MFVVLNFPMATDHLCDCVRMTYCFLWSFPSKMLLLMTALMLMLLYKNLSMMLWTMILRIFIPRIHVRLCSHASCWSELTLLEVQELEKLYPIACFTISGWRFWPRSTSSAPEGRGGGGGGDLGEGASGEGEGAIYLGAGHFLGGCFIMRILPI